jgi:type III secretion protein V
LGQSEVPRAVAARADARPVLIRQPPNGLTGCRPAVYFLQVAAKRTTEVMSMLRAGDVRGLLSRYADLALAGLVVSIVGMMIVPLPTLLLDLLISVNIAAAVTLLLVAIYVSDALKIATFPTLLLLTTLFRLALEVSATRLILLRADAGEVIRAFGNFVVAGNLVVGAVIFLILTMIQFIVISKGSERVAEVAARFTLDAMPGKQMSIDAELRAGHIDHNEARRRRAALTRESQLFGSMDGAMKFVKGDAIAGIVVLAVNIVGGLIIGIVQRGLDASTAARTYTVLTIGEGLVSQIPALVISTSAGIIVTRVASEEEGGHLGRDIGLQIIAQPKAIAIAAGLLMLLAVVPGLPAIPFLTLAVILGTVAWKLLRAPAPRSAEAAAASVGAGSLPAGGPRAAGAAAGDEATLSPLLTPVAVEVSKELGARLGGFATELVPSLRERLFAELGLPLPAVRLRPGAPGLEGGRFVIRLNEVPLARGEIARERWDAAADEVGDAVLALLRRYGHELFGLEEAQALLDALERTHPTLVREVIPKLVSPVLFTDIARRLVEEGISLRNLKDILGALAEWAPHERDPVALTEHVRAALRRVITHRYAGDGGALAAYLLDPMIEDAIREAVQKTATGSYLALEPQLSTDIVAAVGRAVGPGAAGAVLLTGAEIRRYVRRLVETDHPNLAVLSFQELAPEAQIRPIARITV